MMPHDLKDSDEEQSTEALQTDIMRFMAMVSLCLMAIFALVKIRDEESPPPSPDAQKIAELQATIRRLQAQLDALRKRQQADETRKSRVETSRDEKKRERQIVRSPARNNKKETRKGFSLRFASPETLMWLAARQWVSVYAFAGGRSWQAVFGQGGKLSFVPLRNAPKVHRLVTDIPPQLIQAAKALGQETVAWGVVLPKDITLAIRKVMQTHAGGELYIDRQGKVHLEE